jgi:hypothetical protein
VAGRFSGEKYIPDVENSPKSSPCFRGEHGTESEPPAVMLSGFSLEVLEAAELTKGWAPEETVERAIRAYLDDRKLRPPGWACLPLPERDSDRVGQVTLEVELPDGAMGAISAEAEGQGVVLEDAVAHALMYFWAAERPPSAASEESEGGGPHDQGPGGGGETTGAAPTFARDLRRLSRPR